MYYVGEHHSNLRQDQTMTQPAQQPGALAGSPSSLTYTPGVSLPEPDLPCCC